MKIILSILLLISALSSKNITPNDVYAQVILIQEDVQYLLEYYGVNNNLNSSKNRATINTQLKPRNTWQKTYEILVKINMLRKTNNLPRIEPIGMEPVINLNPDMVYEQTIRILAELDIYKIRLGLSTKRSKIKKFSKKTPVDVYNALSQVSLAFDKLNRVSFTPSYVFAETIRVHEDLNLILEHLKINDKTIPSKRNHSATPSDTFNVAMKTLNVIKDIQYRFGLKSVDFSAFKKENITPSDVFTITQMIIAELQPIKAYIGLSTYITTPALTYIGKTPADVDQLMNWNLRKIKLIKSLGRR
jgi:hypothetical protein